MKEKNFLKKAVLFGAALIVLLVFLPVSETAFAEGELLKDLSVSVTNNFTVETNLLLKSTDFSSAKESYDLGTVTDSKLNYHKAGGAEKGGFQLRFSFTAPEEVTVTADHYGADGLVTKKNITTAKWADSLQCGKNTFEITASDGNAEKTYTFSVNVTPSLTSLSLSSGNAAVHLSPEFSSENLNYSAEISTAVTKIKAEATPKMADYSISYNENPENEITLSESTDKITVKVTGGAGANALSTEYQVSLNKAAAESVTFVTEPADCTVIVYDGAGQRIYPDSFGGKTFTGIFSGGNCTYTVSRSGCSSKSGTVSAGTLNVSLSSAGTALENLSGEWKNFRNSDVNMAITAAKTPTAKTELLWSKSFGSGWDNSVGLPLLVDGSVYVMYGNKIAKLDPKTGNGTMSAETAGEFNWGYTPMTYADGILFLPLDEGTIQAVNAKTLESLWVYKDPLKGQSLSPIVYSDGYIYTGFWNGETQNASFVCLSVTDENPQSKTEDKTPVWKITQKGGYYWAGAVVVGDAVIFGSDDGENGFDGENAVLCSLNKYTGETISRYRITGDQRSSIAYSSEAGKIYFTTKCGYLYSASVNSGTGVLTELKYEDYGAQSTSTPLYYKGRLYFGTGSGISTAGSSGDFVCAEAESLKKIYSVSLGGYPQCSMLLSTAYESAGGKLYFYSSYNSLPGGVAMVETTANASSATMKYIYEPENSQYGICSMICDSEGNIYYKNDSGTLFAIKGASSSSSGGTGVSAEAAVTKINAAKPGETVTINIPNMETTVSRRVFLALMKKENVTLKLQGPHFEWYFSSENAEAPEEGWFSPWVVVSSSKTIANGYFPEKKVLSVTFMEEYGIPGRATLMLPRLSPYYESGALSSSAGAALYEYTRENLTDANERFAFDPTRFAITVTELKDYLITEAEGAAVQSTAAGENKPQLPADEQPAEGLPETEAPAESENLNAERYEEMAAALTGSVNDLRALDSALKALDEKYSSDMTLMTAVSAAGMLVVAAAAAGTVYLTMKRKITNGEKTEK